MQLSIYRFFNKLGNLNISFSEISLLVPDVEGIFFKLYLNFNDNFLKKGWI